MKAVLQRLRAQLEREESTRGFAVFRLLVVAVVFFYTTKANQFHPGYIEAPPLRQFMGTLLMLSAWTSWIGLKTRISVVVLALSWGVLHLGWGFTDRAGHVAEDAHMFQALVVLAVSPCGRSLSVDRWLAVRRARIRGEPVPLERGPLWPLGLMVVSLSCMYFWIFAGLATPAWTSGFTVEQIWLTTWGSSDAFALHPELCHLIAFVIAWGVLGATLALAVGLLLERFRTRAIICGLVLHLFMWPIVGMWPFSLTMILVYAAILPPQGVHDFFDLIFDVGERR